MADYGYENTNHDYGYGDAAPDYGYGESQPDYGYGEAQPDYGYGDAAPAAVDYGYGNAEPEAPAPIQKPKRRCSVTKYSIQSAEAGTTEAHLAEFHSHTEMIANFRNAAVSAPRAPQPAHSDYSTTSNTTFHTDDGITSSPGDVHAQEHHEPEVATKKVGKLSKLRKRLSIF